MASILYDVECPNCSLSAAIDDYYRTGEEYVICSRCGYRHHKYLLWSSDDNYEVVIEKQEGHGVYVLKKKTGSVSINSYNARITDEDIVHFAEKYFSDETNQEASYLVRYEKGEFKVILGTLPEYFFLSLEL